MSKFSSMSGTFGFSKIHSGFIPSFNTATGGTITQVGKYAVHTFTATGTFTLTKVSTDVTYKPIYYCIIGGGAGGVGSTYGGSAGGVRTGNIASPTGSYSITAVGAAGAVSGSGGATTFNGLTSNGGTSTASGAPTSFARGASFSEGGATVYGGGGGAGGVGQSGYDRIGGTTWPNVGAGGPGVDFTMPDGTVIDTYAQGGYGGTPSSGSMTILVWPGGAWWAPSATTYGGGGGGACAASYPGNGMGFSATAAQTGIQGAVIICYRNTV